MERVRGLIALEPDNVELHQRLVEYAFRKNDPDVLVGAYLELAGCLARSGASLKARAVYQQVLSLSPGHEVASRGIQELNGTPGAPPPAQVASSEEYVDLGSLVLGDEAEQTTRWTVAADAPTGDEEADFAKMLTQFKGKVSEHVSADDVSAHHDLGTAYMEMGLLDEAIGEFQMALRASPRHLPTHEVMGRCWLDMGRPEMAILALNRALNVPYEVEDELIGIYYLLGRAHEDRGNQQQALEFYERVFSLDINFEDVTERLRALR
jgi:tetratricopeptide (TPR) repeat protein